MPDRRSIAVVTSSRSDWCHLEWPLRDMLEHADLDPRLVVTGSHLSPVFGHSVDSIEDAGFQVHHRVPCLEDGSTADSDTAMGRTVGRATAAFTALLANMRPDIVLLSADRHELLGPATAALALRLPIAHVEGGEWTAGAIDNAVRNALTMMAHVHFTTTERAARRVVAMGEEPWRVHRVGAPSLDHVVRGSLMAQEELETALGLTNAPGASARGSTHDIHRTEGLDFAQQPTVVAYHPVTLQDDPTAGAEALFGALARVDGPLVFCLSNADAGGRALGERARAYCRERADARLFENLAPRVYWSLLRRARLLLGNSSSGLMETPSLGLPAVNIGPRQDGRERAANVIDVPADENAIIDAVALAGSAAFRKTAAAVENPYGDGRAGERLARVLASLPDRVRLLLKRDALQERRAARRPKKHFDTP